MRLRQKLLLISEAVLLITVAVLLGPVWNAMRGQVVTNMQNELKAIAATAALGIDGDLHRRIRVGSDAKSEAFETLRSQLAAVQVANGIPINHIYTFYRDGEQMRFAVMLNPIEELFIGDAYPIRQSMLRTLETGAVIATELYPDEHGEWISAYAPIRDSEGTVVGLLEVDKDSATYYQEFRYYTRLTIALALVAIATSSILGWWVLQHLVIRPVGEIRKGMLALGRRDFTHRVELNTNDELEDLGDTLNDISQQLDVARIVQSGFFPDHLPEPPGYRLAAQSIPCDATGGDYYDAFTLDDDRIAILVADVSGHGLGPSLLMATCRSALRGLSFTDLGPGELVTQLNTLLKDDLLAGRFITLIYGVLEPDGTFAYSNFGHAPALVVSKGTVRQLESHRPPLGIYVELPDEPAQSVVTLHRGDRILLASDGLPEALNGAGEQLGMERVIEIVGNESIDCETVVARLQASITAHCGGRSKTDDVTLLCADRT